MPCYPKPGISFGSVCSNHTGVDLFALFAPSFIQYQQMFASLFLFLRMYCIKTYVARYTCAIMGHVTYSVLQLPSFCIVYIVISIQYFRFKKERLVSLPRSNLIHNANPVLIESIER
jgi:hypothetical protein